nr:type IV secretory system conjugative DNA transfer family protein [uncultured Oscillibacter sp.]
MTKHQIEHICWREVSWSRPFDLDTVLDVLMSLSTLSPRGAVIWEVRGKDGKVVHLLGADQRYIDKVAQAFRAYGDIQFREISGESRTPIRAARQLKITKPVLSLNTNLAQSVIRAGLAAMTEDKRGTEMVLQVVFGKGIAPSPTAADLPDPHATWLEVIFGSVSKATAEARKTAREKAEQHGFEAAVRIGVSDERAASRLRAVISALKILESAGVRIHDETEKPEKLNSAHVPWHFPLRLSVKELANFLLLPAGEEELPGTPGLHPKLTLPPVWYREPINAQSDRSLAISMDMLPKKLSISPKDSLGHTHLIGPTGSGKSTAMQHLILSDIKAGRSVLVLDPKNDLVTDILARIPEERTGDVVVIDPSSPCPVGFNPLGFTSYRNKALIADAVLSVLREIWADSWGVRIQDILSASLLTLAEIDGASLLWLQPLLTDDNFRRKIVSGVKDKVALLPFWAQFEALSELQRRQQIEPVLNKLRQFTLRPGLRNVLGQAHPKFSLMDLFTQRKIVLVPLNRGIVGGEAGKLLGSLIVGLTWTLALSRANLPPERRHLVSVYIDELQDYLSLPTDLSDALAQARGLGVGMTLAHQYRDQLPPEVRAGVDANCRNKIVFGLNSKDAKDMAAMAPELSAEDFMVLPRYQIYTSFQSGGKSTGWVMGRTLPPTPALRDPSVLYAQSMRTYGTPAEQTEEEYLKTVMNHSAPGSDAGETPIGRRKR